MVQQEKSSFAVIQELPLGSVNKLNNSVTRARLDANQEANFSSILAEIFREIYGTDIKPGSGPYMAVVLDVLSGQQVIPKTKGTAAAGPDLHNQALSATNSPNPVTVLAKIPELDADIPWPDNDKDKKRIQLHGEFVQRPGPEAPIPGIANIKQGSIIWVQYTNDVETVSHSGAQTGYIVGVHTAQVISRIVAALKLSETFNPPCKVIVDKNKPAPGFYVGEGTDQDPYPSLVDFKIKNHIKTGMYGGGHPRTKAHFKAALDIWTF